MRNLPLQSQVSLHQVKEMGQSVLFAVLLLTLAAAGCQAICNRQDNFCYLYPLYQRLEASLVNDSQTLYTLWHVFFPLYSNVPPAVSVKVCTEVRKIQSERCIREGHSGEPAFSSNTSVKKCWWYQWSSSSLLAMLTADELVAFDNILFTLLYGGIGPSLRHNIDLVLQPESLPCMPSASEMETTLTTLLSWVSVQIFQTCQFCILDITHTHSHVRKFTRVIYTSISLAPHFHCTLPSCAFTSIAFFHRTF